MKKMLAVILVIAVFAALPAFALDYPTKNIDGVIQWGAGGGTDSLMRPLGAIAEKILGKSVVMRNMAGGTGSIAAQYVYDQPSNGYTLLLGAENPALYKALNISSVTYDDFTCVLLIGGETAGVIVNSRSKYIKLSDIIEDALKNPGQITVSTTGTGGLPWEVCAMITSVTGATFNQIPYDSDASARTAVLNGECAFTVCKVQQGLESHKSGDMRYLAMIANGYVDGLEDVAPITDAYPEFDKYLPWGPFYGVFVKKGTDEAVTDKLSEAFAAAFDDAEYKKLLSDMRVDPLGLTGEDADGYIANWQKVTLDSLEDSGAVKR